MADAMATVAGDEADELGADDLGGGDDIILRVDSVVGGYGSTTVLHGTSFEIRRNAISTSRSAVGNSAEPLTTCARTATCASIANNSRFDYAYRATLVLPGNKTGPGKSCAVPANGRLAIEHWPPSLRGRVSGMLQSGYSTGFMIAAFVASVGAPIRAHRSAPV